MVGLTLRVVAKTLFDADLQHDSRTVHEAMVHIVDARTGEDQWVGWAQASVESALTGPDAMRAWVYDLVGAMFQNWPVPPRAPNE